MLALFNLWLVTELVRPPLPPLVPRPREATVVRAFTLDELRAYNGATAKDPIYMAVRGRVYDVSRGRNFYGPGADGVHAVAVCRDRGTDMTWSRRWRP